MVKAGERNMKNKPNKFHISLGWKFSWSLCSKQLVKKFWVCHILRNHIHEEHKVVGILKFNVMSSFSQLTIFFYLST